MNMLLHQDLHDLGVAPYNNTIEINLIGTFKTYTI